MKNTTAAVIVMSLFVASCHFASGPVDIQVLKESRPVGASKELSVEMKYAVGQLEITRGSDDLFAFDMQYDRNHYDPRFDFNEGDRSILNLELNSRGGGGFGSGQNGDNDLTMRLTDKVPVDLNLSSGVSESRLELTGIKIRRMNLRGGVGKTEITFDKPSGQVLEALDVENGVGELTIHGLGNTQVQQLDFKGGVGHAELDFAGDLAAATTAARIKVGIGEVRLTIPREADVEIEAEGSFLSNISAPSFEKNGRNYTHRGGGTAKIRIRIESGLGSVEIELI